MNQATVKKFAFAVAVGVVSILVADYLRKNYLNNIF